MRCRSVAVLLIRGSDLRLMRNQLTELGFDVPRRSYGFGDPEESAKKVPDAKLNSQTRGLSIPRSPVAFFLPGLTQSTMLTVAQQPKTLSTPHLHQGSESARSLNRR
jgi:hypothetical protein